MVKDYSLVELKASVYDMISTVERIQIEVKRVNQLIAQKLEAEHGPSKTTGNSGNPKKEVKGTVTGKRPENKGTAG